MDKPTTPPIVIPYVVPSTYPIRGDGWSRPLGHDVHVVLALDLGHLVKGIGHESFEQLGFASVEQCWETAMTNIDAVFATRVQSHTFPADATSPPFILCGDSWFAASCIVVPRLHAWARERLGSVELLVSIPNPNALVVFPKGTRPQRQAMREKIHHAEAKHRKPITWQLFELSEHDIRPFDEPVVEPGA